MIVKSVTAGIYTARPAGHWPDDHDICCDHALLPYVAD